MWARTAGASVVHGLHGNDGRGEVIVPPARLPRVVLVPGSGERSPSRSASDRSRRGRHLRAPWASVPEALPRCGRAAWRFPSSVMRPCSVSAHGGLTWVRAAGRGPDAAPDDRLFRGSVAGRRARARRIKVVAPSRAPAWPELRRLFLVEVRKIMPKRRRQVLDLPSAFPDRRPRAALRTTAMPSL